MSPHALLLVAEDDPDDQYFFQEALAVVSPRGVETHFVLDGAQLMKALGEKIRYRKPDSIVELIKIVRTLYTRYLN
jgi:hypothetical protein